MKGEYSNKQLAKDHFRYRTKMLDPGYGRYETGTHTVCKYIERNPKNFYEHWKKRGNFNNFKAEGVGPPTLVSLVSLCEKKSKRKNGKGKIYK